MRYLLFIGLVCMALKGSGQTYAGLGVGTQFKFMLGHIVTPYDIEITTGYTWAWSSVSKAKTVDFYVGKPITVFKRDGGDWILHPSVGYVHMWYKAPGLIEKDLLIRKVEADYFSPQLEFGKRFPESRLTIYSTLHKDLHVGVQWKVFFGDL